MKAQPPRYTPCGGAAWGAVHGSPWPSRRGPEAGLPAPRLLDHPRAFPQFSPGTLFPFFFHRVFGLLACELSVRTTIFASTSCRIGRLGLISCLHDVLQVVIVLNSESGANPERSRRCDPLLPCPMRHCRFRREGGTRGESQKTCLERFRPVALRGQGTRPEPFTP